MKTDVQKPHKQRGLMSRVKSWLKRPGTIRMAFAIMKLIVWVAKVFDLF
jgi:hypothetical protein